MACHSDFVQFIVDQCSGAGEAVLYESIAPNIVCSQDLRALSEQYQGKGFRFKVEFQSWLRENACLTFRDAHEACHRLVYGTRYQ